MKKTLFAGIIAGAILSYGVSAFAATIVTSFTAPLITSYGGTGTTTANSILPNQTSNSGKYLTTNGNVPSWASVSTASSTLLGDTNTWSGTEIFSNAPIFSSLNAGALAINASHTVYRVATSSLTALGAITLQGGTNAQVLGGVTPVVIKCTTADTSNTGCISSTDWNTFNSKQDALSTTWPQILTGSTLSFGWATTSQPASSNLWVSNGSNGFYGVATGTVSAGSSAITVTAGRSVVGGALAIDCAGASGSQNGCLSSADWSTFNSKQAALTFTYPLVNSANTITGFGTTSTWGLGNNGIVMTGATGIPFSQATSSALAISISGNASTVTTNANLSGVITSSGNTTSYGSQTAGVLGNSITGNTAPMATSTLYGAVQNGKVLTGLNGVLGYAATTTFSGALAYLNGNVTVANNGLTLSMFPQVSANRLIGNASGATANAGEVATSSLFTGTVGQSAYFSGTGNLLGTSSLLISTAGNVGISTTSPWAALSVSTLTQQDGAIPLFAVGSTTNDSFFTIMSNGNVGIGKTNPTSPLWIERDQDTFTNLTLTNNSAGVNARTVIQIASNNSAQLQFENYGTNNTAVTRWGRTLGGWSEVLGGILGNGMAMGTFGATPLILGTNGNAVQTITSGGNVGIATTTPSQKLDVNGNINLAATVGGYILMKDDTNGLCYNIHMHNGVLTTSGSVTCQ